MSIYHIKVVLLGETSVGKTSIAHRFTYDGFKDNYTPTIGASFMAKPIKIPESGDVVKFEIWDTAGQEMYRSLAAFYYKDASAAVLVYDITNKQSFSELRYWVEQLREKAGPNVVIAIAANKGDLFQEEEVETKDGLNYAEEIGAIFKQTSAKEDMGIEDMFMNIALKVAPNLESKLEMTQPTKV